MAKHWKYMGDVNLEHGGTFYDFSEWQWGYVPAVEVTDLDSATGYRGAVLVESITINVERPREQQESALSAIGAKFLPNDDIDDNGRVIAKDTAEWRLCLAYACQAYSYTDTDDLTEILQLERDGEMQYDGWQATKKLRTNASLETYVRKTFLNR